MRLVVRSVVGVMASGTVANTRRGLRSVRTLPTPLRALQRTVLLLLRMKIGNNKVMSEFRSVLKSKQTHAFDCVKSIEEPSPTITAAMGMGGGMVPMLTDATIEECKTDNFMKQARKSSRLNLPEELKGKKFRIRKLTPRECFRLMGVEESDIDIIQSCGVSNSGQYKLAGNSIVVDVLYHIFRKAFVETENESKQLSLF